MTYGQNNPDMDQNQTEDMKKRSGESHKGTFQNDPQKTSEAAKKGGLK